MPGTFQSAMKLCQICSILMMVGRHFLWLFALGVVTLSTSVKSDTVSPFVQGGVVPEVLDAPPKSLLVIKYPFGLEVKAGQELPPTQVAEQPEVIWEDADPGKLYTLLMINPDSPARRKSVFRELMHWLVINIPGGNATAGELIHYYIKPSPPEASGLHRHVFLVYEQPDKIVWDGIRDADPTKPDYFSRVKFSTRTFAKKYNLGEPIAGNFFESQWDESVARLHEQLSAFRASGALSKLRKNLDSKT